MIVHTELGELIKKGKKFIALDYDDTYTAMPEIWDKFISSVMECGHRIFIVTYRSPEYFEEVRLVAERLNIPAIATDGEQKEVATDSVGVFIDIWIDDMPGLIRA